MRDHDTMAGRSLRARLAAALHAEDGAMRHDRMLLIAGGAVLGAFVLMSWPARDPVPEAAADGGAPAEAPLRVISSGAVQAPEPVRLADGDDDGPRGFLSPDHDSFLISPPDNEEELLERMTERARAAEAAARAAAAAEEAAAGTGDGTEAAAAADGT